VLCVLAALVGLLGVAQVLGSVALRADARPGSWVRLVPASFAARVDALDPALPVPETLRIVLTRRDIERGDVLLAARNVARLRPSRDRLVLQGELAEARREPGVAVAAYLAAGDVARVQTAIDGLAARGDLAGALALERAALARLANDRTQADALAEADFHLGLLLQARAYRAPAGAVSDRADEQRALDAYARATQLAPLSLRYLLALGNQQLNVADIGAAERSFARARDVDPTSAEPLAGLADAALRRGDRAAARAYLERARALAPASPAVLRVQRRLGP
jgi:tetratricopeptide (TPR) repeat protein